MDDGSTTKTVLMLLARRAAVLAGGALVTHGFAVAGDPNLSGFTEVLAGALVVGAEFCVEWWRKSGTVLISAELARLKGIPLPKASKSAPLQVLPNPQGYAVAVEVKSSAA